MRRDFDGYNDEAMADPTVDCRELITGADFANGGQIFWLRYLIVYNSGAAGVLDVYDQNEGVAVAANQRFAMNVPAASTTVLEIPAPGISFTTCITAGLNGGIGTIGAYGIHAGGFVVGGME